MWFGTLYCVNKTLEIIFSFNEENREVKNVAAEESHAPTVPCMSRMPCEMEDNGISRFILINMYGQVTTQKEVHMQSPTHPPVCRSSSILSSRPLRWRYPTPRSPQLPPRAGTDSGAGHEPCFFFFPFVGFHPLVTRALAETQRLEVLLHHQTPFHAALQVQLRLVLAREVVAAVGFQTY